MSRDDEPTPLELEVINKLHRLGLASVAQLAAELGRQKHNIQKRLHNLRRKGFVEHNGKRGSSARWTVAPVRSMESDNGVGPVVSDVALCAIKVHRELRQTETFRTIEQLAGLISEPEARVSGAVAYLVERGVLQPMGDAYHILPPVRGDLATLDEVVMEWSATLSEGGRANLSSNDLIQLRELIHKWAE